MTEAEATAELDAEAGRLDKRIDAAKREMWTAWDDLSPCAADRTEASIDASIAFHRAQLRYEIACYRRNMFTFACQRELLRRERLRGE